MPATPSRQPAIPLPPKTDTPATPPKTAAAPSQPKAAAPAALPKQPEPPAAAPKAGTAAAASAPANPAPPGSTPPPAPPVAAPATPVSAAPAKPPEFYYADTNFDARIEFDEAQKIWPQLTRKQFDAADLDGSGTLNADEYALMVKHPPK